MSPRTTPATPPNVTGFWSAELARIGDEHEAETGRRNITNLDAWTQRVADEASAEAMAQMAADFEWIHQQQPRWEAKRTVARIEADVAAKRQRDLARARLSNRMAIRLSGILEWSA